MVTLNVANGRVFQILINTESFAYILFISAFRQVNVEGTTPRPIKLPLYGYGEERVYEEGGHLVTCDLQPTPHVDHPDGRLSPGRLALGLQCNYRSTNPECHLNNHLHLLPGDEVPSRKLSR